MKNAKIMLTTITVLAAVGGVLAFKVRNTFNGNFICQDTPGACTSTIKYKIAAPPDKGETLFCDNGNGDGKCENLVRGVRQDN